MIVKNKFKAGKKSLFICYTPLQLTIAESIIRHCGLCTESLEVVYIAKATNRVVDGAISSIKKICGSVKLIKTPYSYPIHIPEIYYIINKREEYKAVYLASIENPLVQFILSIINFDELFTFDDGTANINRGSTYYVKRKASFSEYIIQKTVRIKYDMDEIKKISSKHYTIYKDLPNIIQEVEFIPLVFDDSNDINSEKSEKRGVMGYVNECNVMLGSVYDEMTDSKKSSLMLLEACEAYMVATGLPCYYIKHPRNRLNYKFKSMEIITEPVIAEISVKNLLQKHTAVNLYGFMSTCQINLSSFAGVKNKIFCMQSSNDKISSHTNALNRIFNFEVINISASNITTSM